MLFAFFASAASATGQQESIGVGAAAFGEMLLWLGIIVVFILACAWLLKRVGGSMVASVGAIKVRNVVSMGSRERIALIEVGGKHILVGLCPSQINTLHVFDEDVFASQQADDAAKPATDFASKLHNFISRDKDL